jgi:clathrin heavy chain
MILSSALLDSYIKAEDPANYAEVIEISNHAGKHDDLVRFLQMARKTLREPKIDTELAYAYAKTDRLHDMEDFLSMTNVADVLEVGEKCFEDELYQAAKLLFSSISNWARLATTLIYLGENQAAVESARKAGNTQSVQPSSRKRLLLTWDTGYGSRCTKRAWQRPSSVWWEHLSPPPPFVC